MAELVSILPVDIDKIGAGVSIPEKIKGATYTPHVDENGNISWTNDAGLENPETMNIRGPKGEDSTVPGPAGKDGKDGADGKDGEPGKDGKDGLPGKDGKDGIDGKDGAPGKDGTDGKDGKDGQDGKSAYEIAVDNGFEGTEEEWLESLKNSDELITIKDTEVTNISQLPANSCCIHAINSTIGFLFNDDICYVRIGVNNVTVYTIDGHMITLNILPGGTLIIAGEEDQWAKAGNTYSKSQIDSMLADVGGDELITIKDTVITNVSQLPMTQLPCSVHFINTMFDDIYVDDIVYLKHRSNGAVAIYCTDGQIHAIPFDGDGNFQFGGMVEHDYWVTKSKVDELMPDIIKRCVWFYAAGDDISLFAEGNTNVASFTEFIGHEPTISNNNVGLILVDNKLYWTKFNITAINQNSVSAYQEFTQDPILIGPTSGGASASDISFDDTVAGLNATNVQQAIEALADDQVGSEEVQDMIDENLYDVYPLLGWNTLDNFYVPQSCSDASAIIAQLKKISSSVKTIGFRVTSTTTVSTSEIQNALGLDNYVQAYCYPIDLTEQTIGALKNITSFEKSTVYLYLGSGRFLAIKGITSYTANDYKAAFKMALKLFWDIPISNGLDEATVDAKIAAAIAAITDANEVSY